MSYEVLMAAEEGDSVTVKIEDFDDTRYPKEENPREISGEVKNVNEDISHSAGEIQRAVTVGDPWGDGCHIDCGDTSENKLLKSGVTRKYVKAWRPRVGKDRLLLGKVTEAEIED